MEFHVVATPAVARRLRRRVPPDILRDFERAVEMLSHSADEVRPDRTGKWEKVFRALQNHRHVNLRDGWRLCYGIEPAMDGPPRIIIVFFGTHREYDHRYGFKPS